MFSHVVINGTDRAVVVPEFQFKHVGSNLILMPMRGYGYVLAVFANNMLPLGWVDVNDIGFKTVKDYMSSSGVKL